MSFLIRTAALSVLLAPLVDSALAQQAGPATPSATAVSAPASAAMSYRSAFEAYRAHSEQPVESWREANDLVGRIGGWQAYAREGQGAAASGSTAPPATPPVKAPAATKPSQPAAKAAPTPPKAAPAPAAPASAAQKGGHSGHKMP